MSMYFIGIDISKYKHDCCIISAADQKVVSKVTIKNNKAGFNELLTIIHSLANPADIRIGFESTAHYALNLELFLENSLLTFMEVNPVLISEYKKSKTLRRTKTDSVDCESIARWLMTVEYKPHSKGFYHAYSLKSLTRLRDKLIRQRSFYLVKITNVLDHTFPEFKPFFNERLSKTALYLLENYGSAGKMARMNSASYEKLRSLSRGKFSPQQFLRLKELAANTVGVNNSIFDVELNSLLSLYKSLVKEINTIEKEINKLIEEVHPHYMSVPGIGPLSAAVIYSEYGDISNFTNPGQMLAFELKIGKFKPEYISKMDFYLEALDRQKKKENENPSVGMILCASKDDEVVEYAMSRTLSPMMVAEYKLQLPDKAVLQKKLQELINMPLIEE